MIMAGTVSLRRGSDWSNEVRTAAPSLGLMHFGLMLAGLGTALLGPILPVLARQWEMQDSQSGLLMMAKFCGAFLGGVTVSRQAAAKSAGGIVGRGGWFWRICLGAGNECGVCRAVCRWVWVGADYYVGEYSGGAEIYGASRVCAVDAEFFVQPGRDVVGVAGCVVAAAVCVAGFAGVFRRACLWWERLALVAQMRGQLDAEEFECDSGGRNAVWVEWARVSILCGAADPLWRTGDLSEWMADDVCTAVWR